MSIYLKKRTVVVSLLVLALAGLGWLTSIDFWTSLKEVTTIPEEWRWQNLKAADEARKAQAKEEKKQAGEKQDPNTADQVAEKEEQEISSEKSKKARESEQRRLIKEVEEMMAAPVKEGDEGKFFTEYRLDRDRVRDRQIELLKEVANNQRTQTATREEAEKKLLTITGNLSKELEIENLIKAENYEDAVIFLDRTFATVIIKAKSLSEEDVTKITKLVARHADLPRENITVIPKQ